MEQHRTRPGGGRARHHLNIVRPGATRPRPTREQLRARLAVAAGMLREIDADLQALLDTPDGTP
ncbi:MAG: hypothetical protein ACREXJ_00255 [Gammaproteobacteria bacterium]